MTRDELLEKLRAERIKWEALLTEVGEGRMIQPGAAGGWSVKDIVAHVTWYERETVGMLDTRALVGSDQWDVDEDERNAAMVEQAKGVPLVEVMHEAQQVFQDLLEAIEGLADEDMDDPAGFENMPAEWKPWKVIASNTYEHYKQHMPGIRAWLMRQE